MDERADYADPDSRPLLSRDKRRRLLNLGIVALVAVAVVLALVLVGGLLGTESDRHYYVVSSISRADILAEACHHYRLEHPDNRYPDKLSDLLESLDGKLPFVANPDLTDAWGNPLRYALVPNEAGELEPYVWAERTRKNGKTTLHGAKRTANGTRIVFGLPED